MTTGEETRALQAAQKFIRESIPEYIASGAQSLIAEHGPPKISLKQLDEHWDVTGQFQGDDFQMYNAELGINLKDATTNFFCNCADSFSGVCHHVAATAMHLVSSLQSDNQEATAKPRTEWRKTFRQFFAMSAEPEPGRQYFIIQFFPEPGRVQAAFFRARQNKSGISQVMTPVTLEQIVRNPEWADMSPELPQIAEQIGRFLDYFGHRVDIPQRLLTWFLWGVRNEYYLRWQESDLPVTVESKTLRLQIRPRLSEDGLNFDLLLGRDGKTPFSITGEDVHFYGQFPLWVFWRQRFLPVQTGLDPLLVQELVHEQPIVPHGDIAEFLDRVWTTIPTSDLIGQEDFLERMQPIFVPATYDPKLFLDEEGSFLTMQIQNSYVTEHGEVSLEGPNPDLQTGSYQVSGKAFLLRRDPEKEMALINRLTTMNFQSRSPSIWFLEPEEAITFLLDAYPQMVQEYRMFGEQSLNRYKVRLSKPEIVASLETKDDKAEDKWFNLDIAVDYDGERVPIEKIWKAWTQGKRYVQLKDGSYTRLPESWLKTLGHRLETLGLDPDKPIKRKFKQFEAPILDKILEDMPEIAADGFWQDLRMKIHDFESIEPVQAPKNLLADLRPYQLHGLSYLNFLHSYGFGGILADEMGLGKTVQTLAFIQHMVNKGHNGPNLIVVPTSVLPNWEREAQKFVPELRRLLVYGINRESLFAQIPDADLVVTTYALLRRDMDELVKYEFNSVILDEAQNIKNPNTITARSVRRLQARFRLCLSGTPIENNLLELWSLFEFLMPGFLGSQHGFHSGFVRPIRDGDEESLEHLKLRVKPFILRRKKSEVARDLPPKVENVYYCALEDEQMELYSAVAKKLKDQVLKNIDEQGMAKSQMSILDALLKLRQICCHPKLLRLDMPGVSTTLGSGKFEAFKDLTTGIVEDGHKVLVFSQFVQMLHIIRGWLQTTDIPFTYLDGSSKDRFEQVDKFNNDESIRLFLISLKAGGTGLNLTAADYVIHYDPWWNPAVESQAIDRTHRIGQTKQVFAYKMICENTVEEKILKLQEQKRDVAESIIPGQDVWKNITRGDLEMLLEV
ncbi:MAG TPA: DEAD/DEAH box helicase [Desulfonatronum sp.]|nr:DEAD/DEAH box helicase [Desulfonatronum sp.]